MSEKCEKIDMLNGKFTLKDDKTGEIVDKGDINGLWIKPDEKPDLGYRRKKRIKNNI